MTERLLVFGASGQVGGAIRALRPDAIYLDRREADFSNPDQLQAVLEQYEPDCVINASAYTQVDNAEAEENKVTVINAEAPAAIAIYCAARDIPFVHFSTDYVFSGKGAKPWKENDPVGPLCAYGRSKLLGEDKIQDVGGKFLIFRTSWVYDAHGRNFVNTMLRLGAEREELKVVNDQFGAPTYAPHLAHAVLDALETACAMKRFPSGIYHICGTGSATWYTFALAVFEQARARGAALQVKHIQPVTTAEYPTRSVRPQNSRLDMNKLLTTFDISMPDWQEGLKACMQEKFPS